MEELTRGIRELHERVGRLDDLLHERAVVADLRERRADAAHDAAERNRYRIRRLAVALLLAAAIWTPFTAYFAMWMHERVRNTCLPSALLVEYINGNQEPDLDRDEPWYCSIFPATNHPGEHPHGPAGK